jgi:thiol-disulfide isomerase/thioredoxin
MKSKIGIISIVVVVALVGVVALTSLATKSGESSTPAEPVTLAQASDNSQDGSAEQAYLELKANLKTLEQEAQSVRSSEQRLDILKQMDVLLAEFIDSYPRTPESYDAAFEAGMVNSALQKPKMSVRYLEMYLNGAVDAPRDKQAYGHYYLAESYRQLDKYEEAEAEYKIILNQYSNIDPRLTQAAQSNMAMLDSEKKLKVGGEPLPFEVTDTKGNKLSPEKLKGKVVLLDFWATWCGPCRQEMPNVIKVYDKYKDKGFEIVGISLDRSRTDFDKYIDKYNMTWPQFYDGKFWQNEVATIYGVKSIPATYLIDKKGKIRYKSLRGHQLETAVKKLIDE